ncbi:MAG: alpha/beta hydrolase [Polyangiales bacterium]
MRYVWAALFLGCSSSASEPAATVPDAGQDDVAQLDSATVSETSSEAAIDAPVSTKAIVHVHYPAGAKTISLRGSVAPWSWDAGVAMTSGTEDTWTLEADLDKAAEWKPLLDDKTWSLGPNYTIEPGKTVDVYPHFVNTKGKFEKRWTLTSKVLGNTRGVWVYYPPTYLENPRAKFPVVYMHDGQNLFDAATAFGGNEWKVDETMDAGADDGSIREAIVVGPENTAKRIYEYTPTIDPTEGDGGGADLYLSMIATELEPKVVAELPVLVGRENRAMIGSSLGGLVSAYAGAKRGDTFALIGALSPSTWWDSRVILGIVSATSGSKPLRVYVDSGDSGPSNDDVTNTKDLAGAFRSLGFVDDISLKYVVQAGATHSEVYWAQRLPGALRFLLGPR